MVHGVNGLPDRARKVVSEGVPLLAAFRTPPRRGLPIKPLESLPGIDPNQRGKCGEPWFFYAGGAAEAIPRGAAIDLHAVDRHGNSPWPATRNENGDTLCAIANTTARRGAGDWKFTPPRPMSADDMRRMGVRLSRAQAEGRYHDPGDRVGLPPREMGDLLMIGERCLP
jgi:hypothetical protein